MQSKKIKLPLSISFICVYSENFALWSGNSSYSIFRLSLHSTPHWPLVKLDQVMLMMRSNLTMFQSMLKMVMIPAQDILQHQLMEFTWLACRTYSRMVILVTFDWLRTVLCILSYIQITKVMISWVRLFLYNWRKMKISGYVWRKVLPMPYMVHQDTPRFLGI